MFSKISRCSHFITLKKNAPNLICFKRNFSSVWGERNLKWVEETMKSHLENNKNDYDFQTIPFLLDEFNVKKKT